MKKFFPVLIVLVLIGACGKNKFKRSDFLQDFYTNKIAVDMVKALSQTQELKTAIDNVYQDATPQNLALAQSSFKTTLASFEKIAFYNLGDINAISVYNAAYKTSIDSAEIWNNYAAAPAFTADLVSSYSNKEKGIYTLEYLLFFHAVSDSVSAEKFRSYLKAQAETLYDNFSLIKNSWATYETNFVNKSDEGVDGSYNIVINRIIHLLEDLIDKRINLPLNAADARLAVGHFSNSAWNSIKTQVVQLNDIYMGNGEPSFNSIYNSVHKKNRKLADEIKDAFEALIASGDAMTADMNYYVTSGSSELTAYKEKLKALLVLFKLDVAEELDIVLTFGDNDGD